MEKFLRVKDVADMLSIGKSTVWLYTKTGKLPQPIKLSPGVTVWKLSEIEQFINSLK
ncbi:AlpA family phage regulatory protein [Sulfuricurvum sp.]|uniref:helix-turn-helix transcriptional regulator n=1 Tax=Sulfuricurvum sp. TaxID=2025608 RepID=UPI002618FE7E|nr:AlpA family phage regulatory protein [Sulfuricurvum sp.]MDD3598066.1 AlpA family phage regulatory protein [Sulfuricurvum sp.]